MKLHPHLKIVLLCTYRKLAEQSVWLVLEKQISSYMRIARALILTADYTLQSGLNVSQFAVYLDAICILG